MKVKKLSYCNIPTTTIEVKLDNGYRLFIRKENFNDVIICKGDARKFNFKVKLERKLTDEEINLTNEELVNSFK